jgi:hypothetical protein
MDSLRVRHEDRLAYWRARAAKAGRHGEWTFWARGLASVALAAALVLAAQVGLHGGFVALAGAALLSSYAAARIFEGRHRKAGRAVAFHQAGLDRLDGGVGAPRFDGDDLLPAGHPWARQLDLTGPRSLFARLCSARTRIGASTLLDWLLHPADPAAIASRRAAVEELRGRLDLREAWDIAGPAQLPHADPGAVAAWAREAGQLPGPWLGHLLRLVAAAVLVAPLGAAFGWWPWLVVAGTLGLAGLTHVTLQARVVPILASAQLTLGSSTPIGPLLGLLERQFFRDTALASLVARLRKDGAASKRLVRLERSFSRIDSLRRELVGLMGYAMLWPAREAHSIEQWRLRHGPQLATWLRALGEFEALLSIAGYADEHPDHVFAELLPTGPPSIEAEGLSHPLLPPGRAVGNELRLGTSGPRLVLLSGANMAGKSTWLRSIGLALAMARAAVPVRARRLRLTPLSLGVSIDGGDSLLDGESRFMAEVHRLRTIYALAAEATPTLFLVDELLSGTNPQDRIAGATALLEGLLSRGAIGLCSTHDLQLTRLADRPGIGATNAHFASELAGGRLRFDYRLRPGVVGRSNALELMRSVGLDLGPAAQYPITKVASAPPGRGATPPATSTR